MTDGGMSMRKWNMKYVRFLAFFTRPCYNESRKYGSGLAAWSPGDAKEVRHGGVCTI